MYIFNTILKNAFTHWDENLFFKYLADFNIDKDKKVVELSKGMKAKLNIVISLCHKASLLILDEPMNVEITKRDYLTYTPYETFFSSKNAKEKALYNGFIAEKEGQASTFYNLIIFDVETNELEKFKTNFK